MWEVRLDREVEKALRRMMPELRQRLLKKLSSCRVIPSRLAGRRCGAGKTNGGCESVITASSTALNGVASLKSAKSVTAEKFTEKVESRGVILRPAIGGRHRAKRRRATERRTRRRRSGNLAPIVAWLQRPTPFECPLPFRIRWRHPKPLGRRIAIAGRHGRAFPSSPMRQPNRWDR